MAGVSGNRRTLYTKKVIKESLIELLKTREIHQVTVTDICKKADINRGTFYTHYKDAFDLFQSMEDELFHQILKYIKEGDYVYYVHSYYANSSNKELVAYSEYGKKIPGLVRKDNVYGLQFHPEKSGQVGADILKAYKELIVKW